MKSRQVMFVLSSAECDRAIICNSAIAVRA